MAIPKDGIWNPQTNVGKHLETLHNIWQFHMTNGSSKTVNMGSEYIYDNRITVHVLDVLEEEKEANFK